MPWKQLSLGECVSALLKGDYSHISTEILHEGYLKELASHALISEPSQELVPNLLRSLLANYNRELDWNTGSILQHADPDVVIQTLVSLDAHRMQLYEFIGLAWSLGEFRRRDQHVIEFLQDVVANAKSSESWWRAAFALQKLDVVDAVSYLKSALRTQATPTIEECLSNIGDERHLIGVLLHAKLEELHSKILPRIKEVLCDRKKLPIEHIGAAWLIGRLHYLDLDIESALHELLHSSLYEVRYGVLLAVRELRSTHFLMEFKHILDDEDPLLRKIAAHAIGMIDHPESLGMLQKRLFIESRPEVLATITRAIYDLTHHVHRETAFIRRTIKANENGMITDEGDKWYVNPDIYHIFSDNQDPEDLCLRLAFQALPSSKEISNPVDIGSGTGRFAWYILENIPYKGVLHCVDNSVQMTQFLEQRRKRECIPEHRVKVHQSTIEGLTDVVEEETSSLIVASFAFPSRNSDQDLCFRELKSIVRALRPRGHLITIGWDESFNDELSELWYKFVPDGITARSFEEWRKKRASAITAPRNCGLKWFKRGLRVPLEFSSVDTAARVMGYLFGRSAAEEILRTRRTAWSINAGITIDTKEELLGKLP